MSFFYKLFRRPQKTITPEELRKALKNKEFVFFYQPEWDLKTGKVLGVEALMRWESPKRGYVSPLKFIPILEEADLMTEFTNFSFEQTLADLKQLHEVNPDLFVAVNLSVSQLQDKKLLDIIKTSLEKNELSARYLECELTESQNLTDEMVSEGVLNQLSEMEIPVSLDDFGTGYSSFERLKKLNISKLKIDLSFITTLLDDEKNQTIVASIIKLGHDLGFPVLAEGVETTEQQQWLKEHGCDYAQGYWFCRGLPVNQLKAFLTENPQAK